MILTAEIAESAEKILQEEDDLLCVLGGLCGAFC